MQVCNYHQSQCISVLNFQTPTSKQSRYKEQVTEMRKGRNSGLQKEQKEKHMVRHRHSNMQLFACCCVTTTTGTPLVYLYIGLYIILSLFLFLSGPQEHRQTHGNTREPLLENITSEYDLELFRKAQARASEDLVIGCFVSLSVSHFFLSFFLSFMYF